MPHLRRNIAIMAHADAGKTTITEQFLFLGGQTRQPGSVDHGSASLKGLYL
jgi:elongation factor G